MQTVTWGRFLESFGDTTSYLYPQGSTEMRTISQHALVFVRAPCVVHTSPLHSFLPTSSANVGMFAHVSMFSHVGMFAHRCKRSYDVTSGLDALFYTAGYQASRHAMDSTVAFPP